MDDRDPKGRPLRSTKTECVTPRNGEPVWYVSEKELGEIPKFMCREIPTVYHGTKPGDPEVVWDFTRPAGRTPGAPDAWDVLKNSKCKHIPLYVISPELESVEEGDMSEHEDDHPIDDIDQLRSQPIDQDQDHHNDELVSQPTNQDYPSKNDDQLAHTSLTTKDDSGELLRRLEKGLAKLVPPPRDKREIWRVPPPITNPTAEELE